MGSRGCERNAAIRVTWPLDLWNACAFIFFFARSHSPLASPQSISSTIILIFFTLHDFNHFIHMVFHWNHSHISFSHSLCSLTLCITHSSTPNTWSKSAARMYKWLAWAIVCGRVACVFVCAKMLFYSKSFKRIINAWPQLCMNCRSINLQMMYVVVRVCHTMCHTCRTTTPTTTTLLCYFSRSLSGSLSRSHTHIRNMHQQQRCGILQDAFGICRAASIRSNNNSFRNEKERHISNGDRIRSIFINTTDGEVWKKNSSSQI